NCEPHHSDNPDSTNPAAIAKPPPNKSKMPHGNLTADSQSRSRSPFMLIEGMMNKSMANVMAIAPSLIPGKIFSSKNERVIHDNAAKLKIKNTSFSSAEAAPSFFFSSSITSCPPGNVLIGDG